MIKRLENHFNGKYNKYYVDVCSSYIELAYMIKNSDIKIMFVDVDEDVERDMQTVSRHYGLEEFIDMSSYIASAAYDIEKLSFHFLGSLHNKSIMITARSTENPLVTLSSEEELELEDIQSFA